MFATKDPLDDFVYLFVTDPIRGEHISEYVKREQGYATCWLKAYIAAFIQKPSEDLSEDLVKDINKIAMSWQPKQSNSMGNPGEYKKTINAFPIYLLNPRSVKNNPEDTIPTYSATRDGLKEYLNYWLKDKKTANAIGVLGFFEFDNPRSGFYISISEDGQFTLNTLENNKVKKTSVFDINDLDNDKSLIGSLFLNSQKDHDDKKKYVMVISPNYLQEQRRPSTTRTLMMQEIIQEYMTLMMKEIIQEYNNDIKKAVLDDDKIRAIAKLIQHIEQLHPFEDGNIRTCYILLNRLLRDNKLPLTILLNPNRLDACKLDEIFELIKTGQELFKHLLKTSQDSFTFHADKEINPLVQKLTFKKQDLNKYLNDTTLISQFLENVVYHDKKSLVSSVSILVDKDNLRLELQKKLKTSLKDANPEEAKFITNDISHGDYGAALRKACMGHLYDAIKDILQYKDSLSIDINGRSKNGNTALDWYESSKNNKSNRADIESLLIDNGAKYFNYRSNQSNKSRP